MKRRDFKTLGQIHLVANLNLSIYVLVLILAGLFIYQPDIKFLISLLVILFLYLIAFILNVFSARRLRLIEFEGTAKETSKNAYKYSFWFFFPLIFSLIIQSIRRSMWDYYSQSKTKHMTKESEIMKFNIELLESLKEDEFITTYSYNKQKTKLNDDYQKLLEIEKDREIKEKQRSKEPKLTDDEKEKMKWD